MSGQTRNVSRETAGDETSSTERDGQTHGSDHQVSGSDNQSRNDNQQGTDSDQQGANGDQRTNSDDQQSAGNDRQGAGNDQRSGSDGQDTNSDGQDSFSREYVQSLRNESKGYRHRANAAERELFAMKVEATGLIVSADELPFDHDLLYDDEALKERIHEVIKDKPYLKARKAQGNIGQHDGKGSDDGEPGILTSLLRSNA